MKNYQNVPDCYRSWFVVCTHAIQSLLYSILRWISSVNVAWNRCSGCWFLKMYTSKFFEILSICFPLLQCICPINIILLFAFLPGEANLISSSLHEFFQNSVMHVTTDIQIVKILKLFLYCTNIIQHTWIFFFSQKSLHWETFWLWNNPKPYSKCISFYELNYFTYIKSITEK